MRVLKGGEKHIHTVIQLFCHVCLFFKNLGEENWPGLSLFCMEYNRYEHGGEGTTIPHRLSL